MNGTYKLYRMNYDMGTAVSVSGVQMKFGNGCMCKITNTLMIKLLAKCLGSLVCYMARDVRYYGSDKSG